MSHIDKLRKQQDKLLLTERHAAWENVARKLAHEIKNPLTPIQLTIDNIRSKIDDQNINYYINFIVNSLFAANKYFNDQEPWKKKSDPVRLNTIVYTTLEIIRKISFLLYPIIPETSLKALKIFNIKENGIFFSSISNHDYLKSGENINTIDILFKKIEKEKDDI